MNAAPFAAMRIDNVAVATQANVYFNGRCVSPGITLADGTKKSVGVTLPATLTFNTGASERMEGVEGSCEVLLPGQAQWQRFAAGETYHYVCHFG
jgi:purine/pyrimidine-nucleoside phosphorylase